MKLTIEVQQPKEAGIALNEDTSYRWNRIIYTIGGAVALVAIVAFVFFPGGNTPQTDQNAASKHTDMPLFSSAEPNVPSPPSKGTGEPLADASAMNQSAAPTTSSDTAVAVEIDARDVDTKAPTISTRGEHTTPGQTTEPNVKTIKLITDSNDEAAPQRSAQPAAQSTIAAAAEPAIRPIQTAAKSERDGLFSGISTTIHSDSIKRFSLVKTVRDNEPVGELADVVLSKDQVATVFVYSEALDLKDETLRYVWTLNGDKVATVKVPVWSARWRSHSSKYVTANMRGDWKVELRDGSGDLLAMSEFQY